MRTVTRQDSSVNPNARSRRNDLVPTLQVEDCPIAALNRHVRKLRKSEQAHIKALATSIQRLGFTVPVLIGHDNVVIDGESRLQAAQSLGLTSVPCIRIGHLDAAEQRLLRLAVNRLGEKGCWDVDALKIEFDELIVMGAPIEISGFATIEIDEIRVGDTGDGDTKEDLSQAADLVPRFGQPAIARIGDLFQLGPHRLICGDGNTSQVINRLMGSDVARLVLTDMNSKRVMRHGEAVSEQGCRPMAPEAIAASCRLGQAFDPLWVTAALPYLVDGGLVGAFMDWRSLSDVQLAAASLELVLLDVVVLAGSDCEGGLYPSGYSLLPLFKKGAAPHVTNIARHKRGTARTNLWTAPIQTRAIGDRTRKGKLQTAGGPVAMLADALRDLSNYGEIVFDPFLGAGSTLIAAEHAERVCCGAEPDPHYVDLIIRRYHEATGISAIHVETA